PEPSWRTPTTLPEFVTLVLPSGWQSLLGRHNREQLELEVLPAYLPLQRWFGAKDKKIQRAAVAAEAELGGVFYTVIEVVFARGATQLYSLPMALHWEAATDGDVVASMLPYTLARARRARSEG